MRHHPEQFEHSEHFGRDREPKKSGDDFAPSKQRSVFKELTLVGFLTLSGTALAFFSVLKFTSLLHHTKLAIFTATLLCTLFSLTWGSWASLLWARRRRVQTLLRFTTSIPPLLMIVVGAAAFFKGPIPLPTHYFLALIGLGLLLTLLSFRLTRQVRRLSRDDVSLNPLFVGGTHLAITAGLAVTFIFFFFKVDIQGLSIGSYLNPFIYLLDGAYLNSLIPLIDAIKRALFELSWTLVVLLAAITTLIPATVCEFLGYLFGKKRLR